MKQSELASMVVSSLAVPAFEVARRAKASKNATEDDLGFALVVGVGCGVVWCGEVEESGMFVGLD